MNIILTIKNIATKKYYDISLPSDKNLCELEAELLKLLNYHDRNFFKNNKISKLVSYLNNCNLDLNKSLNDNSVKEGDILYIY